MKKILITGCAGFVGFHYSKFLLDKKYYIIGVDNINNYYDQNLKKERLEILKKYKNFYFIKVDITKKKILNLKLGRYQFEKIYHFAAQAGVRHSIEYPEDYLSNNIEGTFNILEFVRKKKIPHLIFSSTSSVYGLQDNKKIKETFDTSHPIQFYAASKKSCEVMLHSYSKLYNIKISIVRFFTLYGNYGRPDMALYIFTKNILNKKAIYVNNFGNHIRDFTHIDDAVKAIFKVSTYKKNKIFDIFNIGNSKPVKLMDYIKEIEKNLNIKAKIKFVGLQKGDVKNVISDNSKLIKITKLKKRKDYKIGVKEFINWFRTFYKV